MEEQSGYWLRGRGYAIDVILLGYFAVIVVLTLLGWAFGAGEGITRLLIFHLGMIIVYLAFQVPTRRFMMASLEGKKLSKGAWALVLTGMLVPVVMVPLAFLELGTLMRVLDVVPDISRHPDFISTLGHYDPDHAGVAGFQLGPYGGATAFDIDLKAADQAVFGAYLPQWARQFHRPWLTGLMQLGYLFYYIAPVVAAVPLLFQKRWKAFREASAVISGCLLLTYLLYLLVPATGPRFEGGIGAWLPKESGWFGAETIYRAIDAAESFRWNAFPSGHVAVSLTSMVMALKFNRCLGLALVLPVLTLCAATIYMGYHYGVDVVGGIGCMLLSVTLIPLFARWFEAPMWPQSLQKS